MDYNEASMYEVLERSLHDVSAEPIKLPLPLLRAITSDFADARKIGGDSYYELYKGVLRSGKVAVKKIVIRSRSELPNLHEDTIFKDEVGCLMRMRAKQHKNIVRFLGYCADTQGHVTPHPMNDQKGNFVVAEEQKRLLCFEYPAGRNLNAYITDASQGLSWRKRYQIIRAICDGLSYLHQNLTVHCDLKPANIWLDQKKVPKIHDFCLSKHLEEKQSEVITKDKLYTSGYAAPEFIDNGVITLKTDIYSLGVLITEILTGEKKHSGVDNNILESWGDRFGTSLEDKRLEQIRVCAEIAQSCLKHDPEERPDAEHIIDMLVQTESTDEMDELDETESVDEFTESDEETTELNILERVIAGIEEPSHLDLSLLQSITENFSEQRKIGLGGCGEVYKGILRNGIVAVKKLFNNRTIKEKMFHREVHSLITVRHENIIRFLGYCSFTEERMSIFKGRPIMADMRERLLCFEYISNGNLENHLADELRGLEWHTRYEIIVGICKGLLYLHKDKDIVHMDLKPANILLDDLMAPKITDFGLSRLDNSSHAATTSRLISPGYCAPEYILEGKSSSKSDIYSLGVIVRELVTGSKKMPDLTKSCDYVTIARICPLFIIVLILKTLN